MVFFSILSYFEFKIQQEKNTFIFIWYRKNVTTTIIWYWKVALKGKLGWRSKFVNKKKNWEHFHLLKFNKKLITWQYCIILMNYLIKYMNFIFYFIILLIKNKNYFIRYFIWKNILNFIIFHAFFVSQKIEYKKTLFKILNEFFIYSKNWINMKL